MRNTDKIILVEILLTVNPPTGHGIDVRGDKSFHGDEINLMTQSWLGPKQKTSGPNLGLDLLGCVDSKPEREKRETL